LTESQDNLVRLIDGEAVRLNKLCTQLLKAAKLEARRLVFETADVKVVDLVYEVLAAHAADAGRNSIRVVVEDSSLTVRADRELLAMILTQYIDNARKYSTVGTPIKIAARAGHNEVMFSVHNFGSAIRIEDRERIFERFYRSSEFKDAVAGTGIGLSVVKKAAEAHNGHVWVISDNKEGTTFYLSIPWTRGGRMIPEQPNAGQGTILVVDDDSSTRRALRVTLTGMGLRLWKRRVERKRCRWLA